VNKTLAVIMVSIAFAIAACNSGTPGSAAKLLPNLPNLPNIKVVEGKTITEYIGGLAEGKTLLAGNPILAGAIKLAEGAIKCYQDIGAVAVRVYSDETNPLSSGMVAIVDRKAVTDLGNAVKCLTGGDQQAGSQGLVQICARTYTLKKDDNEFFIAYLATTDTLCQAICDGLEGCRESQP